nr:BTAD domain-containing putative transcriptional regulator [Rhodococcus sp. 14C212]
MLVRLVAARGNPVSADRLVEDLWGGAPPAKPSAALHAHISHLRRVLGPGRDPLPRSAAGYALNLPVAAVDAWAFEDAVTRALTASGDRLRQLGQALERWREPLPGIDRYPWAAIESDRLRELRRTAVEQYAETALDLGAPVAPLIASLSDIVAADPGRERAVGLLARARYRADGPADALAVIRRSRQYLATELGLDPGPALRAVEHEILTGTAGPVRERAPVAGHGRPAELGVLLDEAGRAARGETRLTWLAGEPGEGKTHLTTQLSLALEGDGWHVARGNCPEVDGAPPGWPWIEILDALAHTDPAGTAAMTSRLAVPGTGLDTFGFARALARHLGRIATDRPLLLVFDDLHRADEPTLHLLRLTLAALRTRPLLAVATYRPAEAGSELAAVCAATKACPGRRIRLAPLTDDGIAHLVHECGVADLPPDDMALLVARTDRNPLFVREFALLIADRGVRALHHDVPAGIADVLHHRIHTLPEATVAVLSAAAVLGREADLDVLAAMCGTDLESLLEPLEPALRARLLEEPAPERIRFTHNLVRETLYAGQSRLRRTRLHGAALAALSALRPAEVAAAAHHAALAATPSTAHHAVAHLTAAARRADALGARADAVTLWRAAVSTHEMSTVVQEDGLLPLLTGYVGALAHTGDVVNARVVRGRAVELARRIGDTPALVAALTSWSAPVIWSVRVDDEPDRRILDPVESLLATIALSDHDRVLLLVTAVFELEGADSVAALAAARRAHALARCTADAGLRCRALNALGFVAYGPDLVAQRRDIAAELRAVAGDVGDAAYQAQAHFQWFLAAAADTELDEARRHADLAVRYAAGRQLSQLLGVVELFRALVRLLAGDTEGAQRGYDTVAAQLEAEGTASAQWIGTVGRIGAATAREDFAPLVAELSALESARPHSVRFPLVLALLDSGEHERARQLWRAQRPFRRDYYWLAMTCLRARAAARLADTATARDCHAQLLPFSGRIAGLDSGSFHAGPVDAALAETAALLGDTEAAHRFREAAATLTATVSAQLHDPAWSAWR